MRAYYTAKELEQAGIPILLKSKGFSTGYDDDEKFLINCTQLEPYRKRLEEYYT